MEKRWSRIEIPSDDRIEKLSQELNINRYLTSILLQRGIDTFETAKKYFRPLLTELHDPFLMMDMEKAVERLQHAILHKEKILIYGDYDVDGTTAVSLVYSYLNKIYPHCDIYIPDRHAEGYGVSLAGIEFAEKNNHSLIIALDCGIKAQAMVETAKEKSIDFIICDHHLPGSDIPSAHAVLDPKRKDCTYPYSELSGCGLGFKFMQGYASRYGDVSDVYAYLDLVAVSIASDIVPITGENRILAYHGLIKLNGDPLPGLKALKEIAGIKQDLNISGIVFTLGPRINAAGRVAHGSAAVELMIAQTEEEANGMAEKINLKNDLRRQFDLDITEEAISMVEGSETFLTAKSTVLFKDTWHKGVIGIVAARCVEKFYRPTIILTQSNNQITGSARSVHGFDLYEAICQCSDLLDKYGGHKYAAGLTLNIENLEAFQKRFEEVVASTITEEMLSPVINVDLPINFDLITQRFFNILKQMEPFGPENPRPIFESSHVRVFNSLSSFKDRHVRFLAAQEGSENVFQAVGFDLIEHYPRLARCDSFQMLYSIEENKYNGNTSIQLRIKDIKFY